MVYALVVRSVALAQHKSGIVSASCAFRMAVDELFQLVAVFKVNV